MSYKNYTGARVNRVHRGGFVTLFAVALAIATLYLTACAPRFGKHPEGERLERVQQSPNYSDGTFRNQIEAPPLAKKTNRFSLLLEHVFKKSDNLVPPKPIPSVKTDVKALDPARDTLVWLGHSSFFLLLDGKRILIDPLFGDHAAPFSAFNKAFAGTTVYTASDMPEIDYLLITHDHWDHLDYQAVTALKSSVQHVVCPLGVGAHLEYWGYPKEKIHEGDWYDTINLQDGVSVHVLPARHFSGRLLTRNKTLWAGFALITPDRSIFISGDTGYGPHFSEIGKRFGGFDLAILENGQYDSRWPYSHMLPEETALASVELGAKALIPNHSGKFAMARHPWDEPLRRLAEASRGQPYRFLTPVLGEPVFLDDDEQSFAAWWEGME